MTPEGPLDLERPGTSSGFPPPTHVDVLPHLVLDGPGNMALDEVMMETASADPTAAVFRTYGWSEPTLSLGYFQAFSAIESDPRWEGVPVVRRPTGGGAIWHDQEITYALAIPRSHPLARASARLYETVHAEIARLVSEQGAPAERRGAFSPPSTNLSHRPFLCFTDRDAQDIVTTGHKVVGSAQRRRPFAVLQHGSLLIRKSARTAELPGIADLYPVDATTSLWSSLLRARIPQALGLPPRVRGLSAFEQNRVEALRREVYEQRSWTRRR